ncbi:hypothetical protein V1318_00995 [Lysobacter sp. CCNWLW3]|uniref:hypothetical protein n=1 Tax=unclassified Lysobacter TaxID=2635362 RepID=UPI002FCEC242
MRNPFATAALAALLVWPLAAGAREKAAKSAYDCAELADLPADAGENDRRLTCTIPDKYRRDVAIAEYIGNAIRRHDLAAWLTTDELVKIKALPDAPGQPSGWLTLERDDDIDVRYFSKVDGQLVAFASATLGFAPHGVRDATRLQPPQPAQPREQRLMAALHLARQQDQVYCSQRPPNTVAFEYEEDGQDQILVFVMTPWLDESVPLGGYAMYRIDAQGERLIDRYEQTRGCVNTTLDQARKPDSLFVSHLTSAAPTMFHVFMSLQYRTPIVVFTTQNEQLWKVERGRIRLLGPDEPDYRRLKQWSDGIERKHEAAPTSSPIG